MTPSNLSLFDYLISVRNKELEPYISNWEFVPNFIEIAEKKSHESVGWFAIHNKFTVVKNFKFVDLGLTRLEGKNINCQYNIYLTMKGCWYAYQCGRIF